MEIILKENVEGLGYASDLVTVKPGFGRNFLIPTGKAILATESAKKVREENLKQRAHKEARSEEPHVWTPVTQWSRMPSSAWKKKKNKKKKNKEKRKKTKKRKKITKKKKQK